MKKLRADYRLLSLFAVWIVVGLVILTSASTAVGHEHFGDSYFFIKRQLLFGLLPGLVVFLIFCKIDYRYLKKIIWPVYGVLIIILLLVFIPGIGSSFGTNANSWIVIAGKSIQPAEFSKLGLVVFLAGFLSAMGKRLNDIKQGFFPALLFGMVPIVLVVLQPDIGTVSIMFSILFSMLFFARVRISYLVVLALLGILGLVAMIAVAPYRAARLTTFLHPELDPQGKGYHINQAFLAIGSGGVLGLGLGHSRQKFQYLPEVHADSIFAIMAEELGFVFVFGFMVLIVLTALRAFMVARHAPDDFGRLLTTGIIVWFLVQSFLNIGAMVGLMPLTGVPLPFVSHGGTSFLVAMAGVGILISVSRYTKNKI